MAKMIKRHIFTVHKYEYWTVREMSIFYTFCWNQFSIIVLIIEKYVVKEHEYDYAYN